MIMFRFRFTVALSLCSIAFPLLIMADNGESGLTHSLIINEVMQSTFGGDTDYLNEYPDSWVEIYNPSAKAVNLSGYAIGKKSKRSRCFVLTPSVSVPAHGHYMIYCDRENQVVNVSVNYKEIHTDFTLPNLSAGGVYLFEPGGALADSMYLPVMPAPNVAYGRETDGSDALGYMLTPTPFEANSGGFASMVLPDPVFSTSSTILSNKPNSGAKIRVKVSLPKGVPSDAVIRYTLNGYDPDENSPVANETFYFTANTTLKAAVFAKDCITPPAATRVFIFHGRKITVPVMSMVTPPENFYDPEIGIIYNNNSHDADKRFNWRRPVVLDYFPKGADYSRISEKCEVRISGAYSRENAQKSFIVYADSRFGTSDYFYSQLWPYTNPDMIEIPSFGLRNSGNDFNNTQMRDGVAQMIFGMNTDIDWQGFQPSVTYINGSYYGILNIRERGNEDNVWMHHGNLKDITLLENGELKVGDYTQFEEFEAFYSGSHTLAEYNEIMDVEEYTNEMMVNIYMSNTDFPGNNYVLWRPLAEGGKWRWILKDVDRCFGIWGHSADEQYLRWVLRDPATAIGGETANSESSTRLFRKLIKIKEYKEQFIDRFMVYLGDFLTPDYMNSVIDWAKNEMAAEMPYHRQTYPTWSNWESEVNNMKAWGKNRTAAMYRQIRDYFGLGALIPVTVNKGVGDSKYRVTVNGIPLSTDCFDGNFYAGRTYRISGSYADEAYEVMGWEVTKTVNGKKSVETFMTPEISLTPDAKTSNMVIKAIRGTSAIGTVEADVAEAVNTLYYNPQGIVSSVPFPGMNIVRYIFSDGTSSTEKRIFDE